MKPIVISAVDSDENQIRIEFPGGKTVKILRLDYVDEDTFDAMNAELEALDVQQQLVAVANDIATSPVGTKLPWQPLLDATKETLIGLGVEVKRVVDGDERRDEVSAPTDGVVEALKPYSGRKPLPLRKRGREIALTMLKHVVDADELELFEKLVTGQLNDLLQEWRNNSKTTQGE
jgi:hypothetical protein